MSIALPEGDPLAALLGGGGPPPGPPSPEPPVNGGDEVGALKTLMSMTQDYMSIPGVTETEKAKASKALVIFQTLLAENEKMEDQIMGGSTAQRKALAPRG